VKREVIAVVTALSLMFAASAFAIEGVQPSTETDTNFEQMKADNLKRLDDRINRLQQEKTCMQEAKNQDDLRNCRRKNMGKRPGFRDEMRKSVGPAGPGDQVPPQMK
jgi:hypothetical protein